MYLTLLNLLFNKHISHIRPNHLSGYALVPKWPDNRGRIVLHIIFNQVFLSELDVYLYLFSPRTLTVKNRCWTVTSQQCLKPDTSWKPPPPPPPPLPPQVIVRTYHLIKVRIIVYLRQLPQVSWALQHLNHNTTCNIRNLESVAARRGASNVPATATRRTSVWFTNTRRERRRRTSSRWRYCGSTST